MAAFLLQGLEPLLTFEELTNEGMDSLVLLLLLLVNFRVLGLDMVAELVWLDELLLNAGPVAGRAGVVLLPELDQFLPPVDGLLVGLEAGFVREAGSTVATEPDQLVNGGDVAGEDVLPPVANPTSPTLELLGAVVDGGHVGQ